MAQIIARATNTVRNKNIAMIVLFAVFLVWFVHDGFRGYPKENDRLVNELKKLIGEDQLPATLDEESNEAIKTWQGWDKETAESQSRMHRIVESLKTRVELKSWHSPLDMAVQRWIVLGLGVAVLAAIWWFVHCQKRRVIAEEGFVSPTPGVEIPWDKIEVVDNTRWKKSGIVEITYVDANGNKKYATFDDYVTEREPLIQILDMLGEKATKAEFIPKEETA